MKLPTDAQIEAEHALWQALYDRGYKEAIERCAQVADKFSNDDSVQDSKDVAGAIAAAIRALKDKP